MATDLFGETIEEQRDLQGKFVVPPFSVLDARQGYWQERKRAWLALGIESELGRGQQLIENGGGMTSKQRYEAGGARSAPAALPGQPAITATASAATEGGGR